MLAEKITDTSIYISLPAYRFIVDATPNNNFKHWANYFTGVKYENNSTIITESYESYISSTYRGSMISSTTATIMVNQNKLIIDFPKISVVINKSDIRLPDSYIIELTYYTGKSIIAIPN